MNLAGKTALVTGGTDGIGAQLIRQLRDKGVTVIHVESARDMLHKVEAALPADIAIFAAAVADWRVASEGAQKLKKTSAGMPPPGTLAACGSSPISWSRPWPEASCESSTSVQSQVSL